MVVPAGQGVPTPPRAGAERVPTPSLRSGSPQQRRPRASCRRNQPADPAARPVRACLSVQRACAGERRPPPRAASCRELLAGAVLPLRARGPRSAAQASTAGGWGGTRHTEPTDEPAVPGGIEGRALLDDGGRRKHCTERRVLRAAREARSEAPESRARGLRSRSCCRNRRRRERARGLRSRSCCRNRRRRERARGLRRLFGYCRSCRGKRAETNLSRSLTPLQPALQAAPGPACGVRPATYPSARSRSARPAAASARRR